MKESNNWDSQKYNKHADFVSNLALPVVDLLNPQKDEDILDLGCGDGTLALEIQKYGSNILGVDLSENMVQKAKSKGIDAQVMGITNLKFNKKFDAVFSNAVLHWVKERELAIQNINSILKENGRFVAEFGGYKNIDSLVNAMQEVYDNHPKWGSFNNPWIYSSDIEYKELLEKNGFTVEYIELIPRPTPIDDISNWLDVFANGITENLTVEQKDIFKQEVKDILLPKLYTKKDGWVIDYVRLRLKAIKIN